MGFLGDYIDRGENSLEVIVLLFLLKMSFSGKIILLRGSHEGDDVNVREGFLTEMESRFGGEQMDTGWRAFNDAFACLPLAAIVDSRIFCCHGGISPDPEFLKVVRETKRPFRAPESGSLCDLLWADPTLDAGDDSGFLVNAERGCSVRYSRTALESFLEANGFELLVRAHEAVDEGSECLIRGV
jgi:serine/threonine-protein phosphatase PP1 catalytic subunit